MAQMSRLGEWPAVRASHPPVPIRGRRHQAGTGEVAWLGYSARCPSQSDHLMTVGEQRASLEPGEAGVHGSGVVLRRDRALERRRLDHRAAPLQGPVSRWIGWWALRPSSSEAGRSGIEP